ncbi:hypothetical protein [Paenibacillus glycanilyticus]|uniref:hypothetical protein n=1 Tax=Paenibacillus glycanilyticus TaxID=126569 RepID=UPI000FDC7867|nr:hypothetical protein [Paenibacillus glycanilyticus]
MHLTKVTHWAIPVFFTLLVLFLFPTSSYNDSDTFWHIENGRYMIEHKTILHHAIHTFYGDRLPYIPHEYGFEIIEATLYLLFGWPGIYLLTAVSFGVLMLGLYRLIKISRQETGFWDMPFTCTLILIPVGFWVYYVYFTSRPQMISAFLIVWYFVWMRSFKMTENLRYGVLMILCSCSIANIHAGVWPVIAVFSGMQILADLWERALRLRHLIVYGATALIAIVNPGGIRSITYLFVVTQHNYNHLINEWKPIDFFDWENTPIVLMLIFFAYIIPFSIHNKMFRLMMIIGIVYLGVTNYKQNLFLWLFVPYFAATSISYAPGLRYLAKLKMAINPKSVAYGFAAGLVLNSVIVFAHPPRVDDKEYPVDEMNYILDHQSNGTRPKVLSTYGTSGYAMYRGADILCDGREDPFITDASKSIFGWTAFERSMYGFSDKLPEIVTADHPDYLIIPNYSSSQHQKQWKNAFGEPVFSGKYGEVFDLRSKP